MDLTQMAHELGQHVNALTLVVFILLVVSEVLGSVNSIKASSIFNLARAILFTIKDQVFPTATVDSSPK